MAWHDKLPFRNRHGIPIKVTSNSIARTPDRPENRYVPPRDATILRPITHPTGHPWHLRRFDCDPLPLGFLALGNMDLQYAVMVAGVDLVGLDAARQRNRSIQSTFCDKWYPLPFFSSSLCSAFNTRLLPTISTLKSSGSKPGVSARTTISFSLSSTLKPQPAAGQSLAGHRRPIAEEPIEQGIQVPAHLRSAHREAARPAECRRDLHRVASKESGSTYSYLLSLSVVFEFLVKTDSAAQA